MMETKEIKTLIGVDLGGTKVATARVTDSVQGKILYRSVPAESAHPQDVLDVLIEAIEFHFDEEVAGIGIGIPGLVNRTTGVVRDLQNIPSWKEIALKALLEKHFGVPVFIDNDANCFALGELRFGRGKGEKDFVGITLGTGMGGGIIKNGLLLPDAHCGSGEFGNIPYLDTIYEDYCSGKFFKKKYNMDGQIMAREAQDGNKKALEAFQEFGRHVGNAIKTIKLAVDPQKVIIGGSIARSGELFKASMWESILDFPFPEAIEDFDVIFSNTENIAVLGAASLYFDHMDRQVIQE
ncbi:ROK family protein [Candidatus Sulfidibacterium hydrothermale]|uniref:ROK family protein n=1 Tax=Candidatus Sulfidibacterium hydrothermale TaxID=2875962 RepID=UPI001F0A33BC|nr:ROK family protein [Candidatus Sulfidibacterium hydrothermale]UBM62514.1 ROK family protein [Candidatus Sulfidibacterium hydrothermale]